MAEPSVFLVVPSAAEADFEAFVRDTVACAFKPSVRILTDASNSRYQTDVNKAVTRDLIDSLSTYSVTSEHRIYIHRDTKCSDRELKSWCEQNGFVSRNISVGTPADIKRRLVDHWSATGTHWKSYAQGQIDIFLGQKLGLDAWLQQFGELRSPSAGRKLASQLRVIQPDKMPGEPFKLRPADMLGLNDAYCYVRDNDEGGSWGDIKSMLMHGQPEGKVHPVEWDKDAETLTFPPISVDRFIVYEDALWSGSETVRRLKALAKLPAPAPIILKFGIVADFGLRVSRHAIRAYGLTSKVSIDTTASQLLRFITEPLPPELDLGTTRSTEDYFKELHAYVGMGALEANSMWTDEELAFCKEAGSQLITQWLSRRTGAAPSYEVVERFAMGGGGFASTTLFSRSIPKVCLPLLWLDGVVTIDSRQVHWRPLFFDARRVSNPNLLCVDL
ncbi:hypothetical protein [Flavisphingomonas formosensis]|uniref:hypothetical protein n=1 Tax=Flavisphingomonas formosensis TaxID=861534 RepID=UPI0012FBAF33|nr:hypothetical protein [Sphingomonas formosensis]